MYHQENIASTAIHAFFIILFATSLLTPLYGYAHVSTLPTEKEYTGYLFTTEIERTTTKQNPVDGLLMETSYRFVSTSGESRTFIPQQPINAHGAMHYVTIQGSIEDGSLVGNVLYIDTLEQVRNTAPADTSSKLFFDGTPEYKMAVFLVNYTDTVTNPFDTETAHNRIFNGNFANYFEEQSFGKATIDGDVFGWVTENKDSSTCTPMTYIPYNSALGIYIAEHDIDLTNDYDFTFIIQNCPDYQGFVGATTGTLASSVGNDWWYGETIAWSNTLPLPWTPLDRVLTHEVGHIFGLGHANGLECGLLLGTEENIDACTRYESANSFDTMGTSEYGLHFSAHAKHDLGWIPDTDIHTVTESGTYTLMPLETASGTRMLQVSAYIDGNLVPTPYLIDMRSGIGFDESLTNFSRGLNIYRNTDNYYVDLLDLHPTNLEWGQDVKIWALGESETFNDPYYGLTITNILMHEDGSATFDIVLENEQCKTAPDITLNELTRSFWEKNGSTFQQIDGTIKKVKTANITINTSKLDSQIGGIDAVFKIQNTTSASCDAESFSIIATTDTPIIQYNNETIYKTGYKQSVKIGSGGKTGFETTILIPSTITPGTYELTVIGKNNTSGVFSEPYVLSVTIVDDSDGNKYDNTARKAMNAIASPLTKHVTPNTAGLYY